METQQQGESEKENIIDLLPKGYRNKAKLLMHYIPDIKLNNQGRVVYADGSLGSSLYDLVRYFVSSAQMSSARPLDAPKFAMILTKAAVPQSALGSGRSLTSVQWQSMS